MKRGLSERIAQARREMGVREWRDVRRSEIAEAAEVDPSMVTLYEQGKSIPSEGVIAKLAKFFHVTPAYLRYGVRDDREPTLGLKSERENERPAGQAKTATPKGSRVAKKRNAS